MSDIAIAVFAYKRPLHLMRALQALQLQLVGKTLPVHLFIDGPRHEKDEHNVGECIKVANHLAGLIDLQMHVSKVNQGLYKSITNGVSRTLEQHKKIIVIEDDILTSPYFMSYMLSALDCYENEPRVASIHGYLPPIDKQLPDSFFLRGADCWGWATWHNRWSLYRHDAAAMADEIRRRGLSRAFNLGGRVPNLRLLDKRAAGRSSSWAICWHASCFLAERYTLHPGRSLVRNIGLDYSGEHCGASTSLEAVITDTPLSVFRQKVQEEQAIVETFARQIAPPHVATRVFRRLRSAFRNRTALNRPISRGSMANLVQTLLNKRLHRHIAPLLRLVIPSHLPMTGPYASYAEALADACGYESPIIVQKVEKAILAVLEGRAAYERDGTAFQARPDQAIYKALRDVVAPHSTIADFGGGLGGLFISAPELFHQSCRLLVIEQASMVQAGLRLARKHRLPFEFLDSREQTVPPLDVLILSSVLQYLSDPWATVDRLLDTCNPAVVIIDRTAIRRGTSRWYLQTNVGYYEESVTYPLQVLERRRLLRAFSGYRPVRHWHNAFDPRRPEHIGMLLIREDAEGL